MIVGLIIGLIVGFLLGAGVILVVERRDEERSDKKDRDFISRGTKLKEENLKKVTLFLKGKDEVRNDEVENLLKVSDATSERYLDELEKRGYLEQIGKTGKSTFYKVLKS